MNPNVQYRIQNSQPPVPTLSENNHAKVPQTYFLKTILILSSHRRVYPPSRLFFSGFPTKTLYAFLSSPTRAVVQSV